MNPIIFLKQNGLNPDNYRAVGVPQPPQANRALVDNNTVQRVIPNQRVRKTAIQRKQNTSNVSHSLLDTFLHAHGWTSNGKTIAGPFIPYLLADLIYLTYEEHLKGKLTKKAKSHCNAMMKSYHSFIHDFFACFSNEQVNEAVDMMDEFGEHLYNDLEIFRLSTVQPLMEYPTEFRNLFSAICVCRLLAAHADYIWTALFADGLGRKEVNPHLASIEHNSAEMFRWFTKDYHSVNILNINLAEFPQVKQAMNRISDKILEFIQNFDREHK